jgi:TolB protein
VSIALGNPFVVDRPLAAGDPACPRYKLLARVEQWVKSQKRLVLVFGPARMGKTTFLGHLASDLASEWHVARVELHWPQEAQVEPISDVLLRELQERLAAALATAAGQPGVEAPATPPTLDPVLPALPDRPVVALVDGLSVRELCAPAGAELLRRWRAWLDARPSLSCVVTLQGRLDGALAGNDAVSALPLVELDGLTLEETEDLLMAPVKGRMSYNFDALHRIWQVTAGHPHFVQLFGHSLYQRHTGRGRVQIHDVEAALPHIVEAVDPMMHELWQACSPQAQVLLAVSSELRGRHGVLTLIDLQNAVRLAGLELSPAQVESALAELLAIGVLRRLSPDSYAVFSDVLRLWFARFQPLARTLDGLKAEKRRFVPSKPWWESLRLNSLAACVVGVALVAVVALLWGMRGSPQRVVVGGVATATPVTAETSAPLVIGQTLGRIAYMAKDNPDATWEVWVMRGDGSDPKQLTQNEANDMTPTWSPDGKSIAFVSDRDNNKEIYVMKADGTQPLNLTYEPAEDWTPAWAPDGSAIAFASYRDGNWEIYVMKPDGSEPMRLTRHNAADVSPTWSPDSKQIAFASNRDGNWEIYVMNRDGTGLRRLTSDDATDSAPAWSPDGKAIAFESYRDGDMEIYLMATDGSEVQDVSNDHYSNEHAPAWSRDGTRLLYHSTRDGGWDIFSMRPDGTEKNNLTLSTMLEQNPAWHE